MMAQPALDLSEWSLLRFDYAQFLTTPKELFEQEADAVAHRFIDSGISFTEFEALHLETINRPDCDNAMRLRAHSARLRILSAYDQAFLEYQKLARRCRSESSERSKTPIRISTSADLLARPQNNPPAHPSTQHRLLEERSEELEALNQKVAAQRDEMAGFLYSVSHDLKAPLNTIKGLLTFFLEDQEEASMDLSDIEAALATTSRTSVMLDALLSFSQSLDAEPENEIVDLDELVADILQDLKEEAAIQSAEFTKDRLPKVKGSQFQLRLLFQNLISNGVKYCAPDTKPRVEIRNNVPKDLGYTAVAVIDNGIGIDPAYHKDIFGLFKRLHANNEYPGTGFGLTLCQRIVMNHKGHIHLLSSLGEGSKFTVVLPQ